MFCRYSFTSNITHWYVEKPPQQPYKDNDGIHNGEIQQTDEVGDKEKLQQQTMDKQEKCSDDVPSQSDCKGQTSGSTDHASLQNVNYSSEQQLNKETVDGGVADRGSTITCK